MFNSKKHFFWKLNESFYLRQFCLYERKFRNKLYAELICADYWCNEIIFHSNLNAFFFICEILSIWFHQCDCDQISLRLQCDKNSFIVFEIHFELKLQFILDCLLHKLKNLITDYSKIVKNESFDQQFFAELRSVLRNFWFDRKCWLREKK